MCTPVDSNHQKFDVWLFATDIVNLVFLKSSKLPSEVLVGYFPGFVCKDFSDTLKTAVQLISSTVKKDVDEDFAGFQRRNELTLHAYTKHAEYLRKARFCQGFDAEAFLYYCVHMALLAYRFFRGGQPRAQVSAVFCLGEDFQDCGLDYGLWEALNEIAEKIVGGITDSTRRSLFHGSITKGTDHFESPDSDCEDEAVTYSGTYTDGGRVTGTSSKYCSSQACFPKEKHFPIGILSNSCRRVNNRGKIYPRRDRDVIFSLHQSLESSLEQLSISSELPVKVANGGYTSNSTPAESSVTWKLRVLNRVTRTDSFEKRIFKLSPINRIKAENVNFC